MNKSIVVGAVIIAIAVLLGTGLQIYFSPFWACVRSGESKSHCALLIGGRGG